MSTIPSDNTELKVSLDQWRAFQAVIEEGGYARAAERLQKSQSAVSYAITQLETALGVAVFELQGRKAVPTAGGEQLYRRAKLLLEQALRLEHSAECLSMKVEPLVRLAIDQLIPSAAVLRCLESFVEEFPNTRIEILESVLSGTEDALIQRQADLVIGARVPPGFIGHRIAVVTMRGVTAVNHPLQSLGREVNYEDLRQHRQIVVRDSGLYRRLSEGWQDAEQRLTVSYVSTSLAAVEQGMGYAWLPDFYTKEGIARKSLVYIPFEGAPSREVAVYLTLADEEFAGPATQKLAAIFKQQLVNYCAEIKPAFSLGSAIG